VKYLEECYLTAVRNVLKEEKKETMKNRWDVRILSTGVERVEKIQSQAQQVREKIQEKAKKINDRVRWTGRTFNEQLKKRAKSCENVRKVFLKRVKSQQKRVREVYNNSAKFVKVTYTNTRKRTAELNLKMRRRVEKMVTTPVKNLSKSCSKRVKPYYESAKTKISEFATHSFQAANDIKESLVETSLKRTAPLRSRTVDVVLPVLNNTFDDAKLKYRKTKETLMEKVAPVSKTVKQNRISMRRLFGFTWEIIKDAYAENVDLTKQFVNCNKEHINRYLSDVDFELFYSKNNSLSVRDFLVKSKNYLLSVILRRAQEEQQEFENEEVYDDFEGEQENVEDEDELEHEEDLEDLKEDSLVHDLPVDEESVEEVLEKKLE
jgi:hypothetical protein